MSTPALQVMPAAAPRPERASVVRPRLAAAPSLAPDMRVTAKAGASGGEAAVSGPLEAVRTGFALGATALGPLVAGRQTLYALASTVSTLAPVRLARGLARGTLGLVARLPFAAHPLVPRIIQGAERVLPWLATGVFVFDSMAFYKALTSPGATTTQKVLAGARWFCTGASTALFFVPNHGAMFAKIFSKASFGFDIVIKKMAHDAKQG